MAVLLPVAGCYGPAPRAALPLPFDFAPATRDEAHAFRAIMGLCAGMAALWGAGIAKPAYWRAATPANVFCLGGLAAGRLPGICADGRPPPEPWIRCPAETALAAWGSLNLRRGKGARFFLLFFGIALARYPRKCYLCT